MSLIQRAGVSTAGGGKIMRLSLLAAATAVAAGTLVGAPAAAAAPENAADGVRGSTLRAMTQDLGISAAAAAERLDHQAAKVALAEWLVERLDSRAAGSFIDRATGRLVVNVTGSGAADRVRSTDARARVVERSMQRLGEIQRTLQRRAVTGTTLAVDVRSNTVEVTVPEGASGPGAHAFVQRAKSFGDAVEVTRAAAAPRTQALYGGEAITGGGSRCSAGFVTTGGYLLTAGHCTDAVSSWSSDDGYVGPSVDASFPGNDYGLIRIEGSVTAVGEVIDDGGTTDITSAGSPPVGTYVCKTGSTTGTTCGSILAYNTTVNYPSGTVSGLIETDVCTKGGDSGGPLFDGSTAVGLVSGGTNIGCSSSSFRAYFQPVEEALAAYGLSLK